MIAKNEKFALKTISKNKKFTKPGPVNSGQDEGGELKAKSQ